MDVSQCIYEWRPRQNKTSSLLVLAGKFIWLKNRVWGCDGKLEQLDMALDATRIHQLSVLRKQLMLAQGRRRIYGGEGLQYRRAPTVYRQCNSRGTRRHGHEVGFRP